MESKSYSEKYSDPRWQRKRLEIMQRANFRCEWCGSDKKQLSIHHGYYERGTDPWDYHNDTLYCLCEICHQFAEEYKRDIHMELAGLHPKFWSAFMNFLLDFKEKASAGKITPDEMSGIEE